MYLDNPFYPNLNTGLSAVFGNNIFPAADIEYIPNPDLRWETVAAQEIGFELNAFGNKLHFEANYFNKTTKNLMLYIDRSPIGLKNKLANGGSIKNFGEEFSASWNQTINRDFSINIGGNITFLQNRVLSLSDELPNGYLERAFFNNGAARSRTEPGMPIAYFYGFKAAGVFQSYADVLKSPVQSALGAYGPGDLKYEDVNGDGKITGDDRVRLEKNTVPTFNFGANLDLRYKGFDLNFLFQGAKGAAIRIQTESGDIGNFLKYSFDNRWSIDNPSSTDPRLASRGDTYFTGGNYGNNTYFLFSKDYIRLKNLEFGYTLPQSLIDKVKLGSLRVYLNGLNLITFTKQKVFDPEATNGAGTYYPQSRVLNAGVSVTF